MGLNIARFMAAERNAYSTIGELMTPDASEVQLEILAKLSRKITKIHEQIFWNQRNVPLSTDLVCGAIEELRNRALGCFGKDVPSADMPHYSELRQRLDLH